MRSIARLMNCDGRVACITGAAGHIGAAMAGTLVELGARVAIVDRDESRCAEICRQLGHSAEAFVIDLEDESAVRGLPAAIVASYGRLDIIVNCAALVGTSGLGGWAVPFEQQSAATWRRALEVNLTAPFVLTQAAAPALEASGHGSVINVLSIYGLVGPDLALYSGTAMGNPAAYGASKAGLLQLTRYLATTLAPAVRVNAITPGGVWRDQSHLFVDRYIERTPLRRMATEEDFSGAVAYLASDLSLYVTGQNLIVDGGWTVW